MTPIKDDLAVLTAKLSANARVNLYDKNYLPQLKWTCPLLVLITIISLSFLSFSGALNQSQLIIYGLISLMSLLFIHLIIGRSRIAAIKGDAIILKGIDKKSTVTLIRSVKTAGSYHLFGVHVTRLKYTLDHQKKSSLVFGIPSGMKTSLGQLIQHAKKCEKNKRQIISRVL